MTGIKIRLPRLGETAGNYKRSTGNKLSTAKRLVGMESALNMPPVIVQAPIGDHHIWCSGICS